MRHALCALLRGASASKGLVASQSPLRGLAEETFGESFAAMRGLRGAAVSAFGLAGPSC